MNKQLFTIFYCFLIFTLTEVAVASTTGTGTTDDYIYVVAYASSNEKPVALTYNEWKIPSQLQYIGVGFDPIKFQPSFSEFLIPDPNNAAKFIKLPAQNKYTVRYFVIKSASDKSASKIITKPLVPTQLNGLSQADVIIEWDTPKTLLNSSKRSTIDSFISTPLSISFPYPDAVFKGIGRYQFVVDSLNGGIAPYILTTRKDSAGKAIPYITFITYPIKIKKSTYQRIS